MQINYTFDLLENFNLDKILSEKNLFNLFFRPCLTNKCKIKEVFQSLFISERVCVDVKFHVVPTTITDLRQRIVAHILRWNMNGQIKRRQRSF